MGRTVEQHRHKPQDFWNKVSCSDERERLNLMVNEPVKNRRPSPL